MDAGPESGWVRSQGALRYATRHPAGESLRPCRGPLTRKNRPGRARSIFFALAMTVFVTPVVVGPEVFGGAVALASALLMRGLCRRAGDKEPLAAHLFFHVLGARLEKVA